MIAQVEDVQGIVVGIYNDSQLETLFQVIYGTGDKLRRIKKEYEDQVHVGDTDPFVAHPTWLTQFQPDDILAAQTSYNSLPAWFLTYTPAQVETYIDTNVTDIASAKTAMIGLGKALVVLRDLLINFG